ncbi:hypothetical protein [Neobacillus mesonae]|uniref:hypothetical protein n=1 Tax=Neobacillus mesonae TaxID=1193713 RepID=UPI00203AB09A|nr:hypothetical protein [Neobacillus mesonae]MCM3567387.1 hypothetical protein [Neobacillus mesonae]
MAVHSQYKEDPIFSYRLVKDMDPNQRTANEIMSVFQQSKNEYVANTIYLQKKEPDQKDFMEVQGEQYLLLEMSNELGSIDALGIKSPQKSTINISIMTYLFGDKVKEAIEEVLLNMRMYENIYFFIIGTGPLKSTIESMARTNGVDNRLYLINRLYDPYKLINHCDFFIPVPNGRLDSINWRRNRASLSGFIYIPGFHQESIQSAKKTLRFKSRDDQVIQEMEMTNQYIDWLSKHPNHGNNTLNYEYAGFEADIDYHQLKLEAGIYDIFVSISQDEFQLEIPFINSVRRKLPKAKKIKSSWYTFLEYQELNQQLGIKVSNT